MSAPDWRQRVLWVEWTLFSPAAADQWLILLTIDNVQQQRNHSLSGYFISDSTDVKIF